MKQLRYRGEFLSRSDVVWRVDLLQDAETPYTTVGVLDFDVDPLVIEWNREDKEKVICGSAATLRIISPSDRTYEDLYTIEVGRIRMDVYRNNTLYWSGALDPEFYEEPYESEKGYTVPLTFSDFGILDRLKYSWTGILTIRSIITGALTQSAINYGSLNESLISTKLTASGSAMNLSQLSVRSDNFYDEDGEASTLKEAIEGILQPLALKMVQRKGVIYVYDLNGLYTLASQTNVVWDGSRSTMGVDKVANNVKITWNTYAQSGNLAPEDCWTENVDATQVAINMLNGKTVGNCQLFSYHYSTDLNDWIDATDAGFTIWLSATGKNATILANGAKFFKIVEQYDGTESEGVAIYLRSYRGYRVGSGSNWSASIESQGHGYSTLPGKISAVGDVIFRTTAVWLPPVNSSGDLMLRITANLLLDPRFNPFESAENLMTARRMETGYEQKDQYDTWCTHGNFVYIPVRIKFTPDGSNTTYYWTNKAIVGRDPETQQVTTLSQTYGSWVTYENWGYLCYYDNEDRQEQCGVLGWKKNRPAINPHDGKIVSILKNAENGQYIPFPNYGGAGGQLVVEVLGGGWMISDANVQLSSTEVMNPGNLWAKVSWVLMQLPEIEIMNSGQFDRTINTDDVEYNAEVNSAAKESIDIDTICGTSAKPVQTARGAYFNSSTGLQVNSLTRAGVTTQAEELLIATLYSQYAERRTTLSGEIQLPATGGLTTFVEANQTGKLFMLAGESQNIIEDTTDAQLVELRPDEYTKDV